MKRKIFSILFALVLVLSFSLVTGTPAPAGADDAYEPTIGWWQSSNPDSGTAEYSTAQWHSTDYAVHLEAYKAYSPDDYHEVYVANPTGVDSLADLDNFSFWYYCPTGGDPVAPLVDVWLDTNDTYSREFPPSGDDEWLLGMLDDVITYDAWVQVTLEDINWVRATGGTVYGTGSAGLTAALTDLTDLPILAIGIETGGPGTYISSRAGDQEFYVDDLTINSSTYAMDPRVINTTQTAGYNTIQAAIDAASSGDTINVAAGTYAPFAVDTKTNLTIQSSSVVTVQGVQSVATAYTDRDCVVFVKDSTNIVLDDLNIQGQGLGTINAKNYGVIYENSSGEIKDCTVSPNTIGDMLSIAIGIWDGCTVTVDPCTIENFGRVGILVYNGCTVEVLDSTIEGQVYSGEGEVCYGIEVEGAYNDDTPATASHVTVTGNEIYNCDNTFSPQPTWESAGVYINGWLEHMAEAESTVIVENNDIHNNYTGIFVVKSPSSYAHFNNIYDNRVDGVESAAAYDATTAVFDAILNWWGAASGPEHEDTNPYGTGDAVSDNVDYLPWLDASFDVGEPAPTIALEFDYYRTGDTPVITIYDPSANIDPVRIETVEITDAATSDTDELGIDVTLEETGANTGVFTGSFTTSSPPVAESELGIQNGDTITVTYRTLSDTAIVDETAPEITTLSPADGGQIVDPTPVIKANYSDATSGIDNKSVAMFLDGVDVTDDATVGTTSVSYTPEDDLADGSYDVTVNVEDNAGNAATETWSFRIVSWLVDPMDGEDEDALDTVGVAVFDADGASILVGRFASNPEPDAPPPLFMIEDGFFDVQVTNEGGATEIVLIFAGPEITAETTAYVWSELQGEWLECSDQGYSVANEWLWVKVRTDTTPTIAELTGTPFAISGEEVPPDILAYYRAYSGDAEVVETTDLLKAANDWANAVVPPDFTEPISTIQLLALANEWAATE